MENSAFRLNIAQFKCLRCKRTNQAPVSNNGNDHKLTIYRMRFELFRRYSRCGFLVVLEAYSWILVRPRGVEPLLQD